jgi:hypothetical protein
VSVGGARPGAGRKPGGRNKKTREIADRAAAEGITPLEVMLEAMRFHYFHDELDEAAAIAKDAAPYMHPRLATVNVGNKPGETFQHEDVTGQRELFFSRIAGLVARRREADTAGGTH